MKEKQFTFFWIHKEWEQVSDDSWGRCDVMYITGKKYSDVYKNQTLWFSEGELFFEQKWFKLDSKEERYVENLEDWKILDNIHSDRRHLHYEMSDNRNTVKLPAKLHKIALKIIKNKKGYKSVSLKDIESVTRRIGSHYSFNFTKESRKEGFSISFNK